MFYMVRGMVDRVLLEPILAGINASIRDLKDATDITWDVSPIMRWRRASTIRASATPKWREERKKLDRFPLRWTERLRI